MSKRVVFLAFVLCVVCTIPSIAMGPAIEPGGGAMGPAVEPGGYTTAMGPAIEPGGGD